MKKHPSAFIHLPHLRDRIIDPAESQFRMTEPGVPEWDLRALNAGYPPDWRLSHSDREATRQKALAGRLDADLWIFAYGSLLWDPAFYFEEVREAFLDGYQRRFCMRTQIGRGCPEKPGLMAALDHGGDCHGLAFRIAREKIDWETEIIWKREMITGAYDPTFLEVETPLGPVEALVFVMNHQSDRYVSDMAEAETARIIATGKGVLGPNLDYLVNLVEHLELLGLEDTAIFRLHDLARQIADSNEL